MKKTITLTQEQATNLVCYLLMTTNYRKGEREAWEKLAVETTEDGKPKFPNAVSNARFWADTEREIAEISQIIDAAPLLDD
jgi:hypothetical protein